MQRMVLLALAIMLAACSRPQPPEKERPPVPRARHADMQDAIQQPIDQARAVEAKLQAAADAQRAAIDAQAD